VVRQVNDKIYLRPGVDRVDEVRLDAGTRWTEITEEGLSRRVRMPFDYNTAESVTQFPRQRAARGLIGKLVGSDLKSSMIVVPLLEQIPETNAPIDYGQLSAFLEQDVRSLQTEQYPIHIIGFANSSAI
jgi:hypothetical protein